jgi:uncharacterized protein
MHVAVTGSTGLIGQALCTRLLASGHDLTPVTRSGGHGLLWDPVAGTIDSDGFDGVDAVVHLAGAGIAERRWTKTVKARIYDSRIDGTTLLAKALSELPDPPGVLLSGSAIGYYGDRVDEVLTEDSPPGSGFLARLCVDWEAATAPAEEAGIRVAHLRTGLVLAPSGGALGKMVPLFKLGLGGRMGPGRQWWSSISIDDHVAMVEWLLSADEVSGPVNLVGPIPLTNTEFTKVLGAVLKRPTLVPVPKFGPRLLLGRELADELLFTSARVVPAVAQRSGYVFAHNTPEEALRAVLGKPDTGKAL